MSEKQLNTRITQKIDTTANWGKATNFVPKKGELIVYSDGGGAGIPKFKVGDGSTIVGSLKFVEGSMPSTGTWAWTNGTTAGPTAKLTLGAKEVVVAALPTATTAASGIITTGSQSLAGTKTLYGNLTFGARNSDTERILWFAKKSESDDSSIATALSLTSNAKELSIFLTHYPANSTDRDWTTAYRFGQDSFYSTSFKNLGTSSYPFSTVYASKFVGGEATTSAAGLMSSSDKTKLNDLAASTSATASFASSGWSSTAPYTQTISVSGITADSKVVIDVNLTGQTTSAAAAIIEGWGLVNDVQTGAGTLTAYCYGDKPTVALPVNIINVK